MPPVQLTPKQIHEFCTSISVADSEQALDLIFQSALWQMLEDGSTCHRGHNIPGHLHPQAGCNSDCQLGQGRAAFPLIS